MFACIRNDLTLVAPGQTGMSGTVKPGAPRRAPNAQHHSPTFRCRFWLGSLNKNTKYQNLGLVLSQSGLARPAPGQAWARPGLAQARAGPSIICFLYVFLSFLKFSKQHPHSGSLSPNSCGRYRGDSQGSRSDSVRRRRQILETLLPRLFFLFS
jgi:hypothetical protein